jgi:alkylated DNA repair dioxygenase AlkB
VERDGLNICHAVVLDPGECGEAFRQLEREVEYLTGELARVRVFGKVHDIPRQHAAYGDEGVRYRYSGTTVAARPWTPTLARLKALVEQEAGHKYNFVLVNRYKDGADKMGDHKDDEKELSRDVPIASLSLGAERDFVLKHSDRRSNGLAPVTVSLRPGTLLLMHPPTNQHWVHGLPARAACRLPRINLTFRHILRSA